MYYNRFSDNVSDMKSVGQKNKQCFAVSTEQRWHITCMIRMLTAVGIKMTVCIGKGIFFITRTALTCMNMKAENRLTA